MKTRKHIYQALKEPQEAKKLGLINDEWLIQGGYSFEPSSEIDIERAENGEPPFLHYELSPRQARKTIVIDNWNLLKAFKTDGVHYNIDNSPYILMNLLLSQGHTILFCDGKEFISLSQHVTEENIPYFASKAHSTKPEKIYELAAEKLGLSHDKIMLFDHAFLDKIKISQRDLALSSLVGLDREKLDNFFLKKNKVKRLLIDTLSYSEIPTLLKVLPKLTKLNTLTFPDLSSAIQFLESFPIQSDLKNSLDQIKRIEIDSYKDELWVSIILSESPHVNELVHLIRKRLPKVNCIAIFNADAFRVPRRRAYALDFEDKDYIKVRSSIKIRKKNSHKNVTVSSPVGKERIEVNDKDIGFRHWLGTSYGLPNPTILNLNCEETELSEQLPRFDTLSNLWISNLKRYEELKFILNYWSTVSTLTLINSKNIPSLEEISISGSSESFPQIETLIIFNSQISKEYIFKLFILFPNLKHFHFLWPPTGKTEEKKEEKIAIDFPPLKNLKTFVITASKLRKEEYSHYYSQIFDCIPPNIEYLNLEGVGIDYIDRLTKHQLSGLKSLTITSDAMQASHFENLKVKLPEGGLTALTLDCPELSCTESLINFLKENPQLTQVCLKLKDGPLLERITAELPYVRLELPSPVAIPRKKKQEKKKEKEENRETKEEKRETKDYVPYETPLKSKMFFEPDSYTRLDDNIYTPRIQFITKNLALNDVRLYRVNVFNRMNTDGKCATEHDWKPYSCATSLDVANEVKQSSLTDLAYRTTTVLPGSQETLITLSPNDKLTHIQINSKDKNAKFQLFYDKKTHCYSIEVFSSEPVEITYLLEVKRQIYNDKMHVDPEIKKLIEECENFKPGDLKPEEKLLKGKELLAAFRRNTVGACRHRSLVAFDQLASLGCEVTFVENGVHAFIEITLGKEVITVDLGGYPATIHTLPYHSPYTTITPPEPLAKSPALESKEPSTDQPKPADTTITPTKSPALKSKEPSTDQPKPADTAITPPKPPAKSPAFESKKTSSDSISSSSLLSPPRYQSEAVLKAQETILKKYQRRPIELPRESASLFFDKLLMEPSDRNILLRLSSYEMIQAFNKNAGRYFNEKKKQYYYINDLDELNSKAFKHFLKNVKASSNEAVVILRLDKHIPIKPHHVGLNSLFDPVRRLNKQILPKNLRIIPVIESTTTLPEDIRSRITHSQIIELSDPPFCQSETLQENELTTDKKEAITIPLNEDFNWKKKLIGGATFKEGKLQFESGVLLSLIKKAREAKEEKCETKPVIVLENPPWHLEEFQTFWNELKIFDEEKEEFITVSDYFNLAWITKPYPPSVTIKNTLLSETNRAFQCILDQSTLSSYFSRVTRTESGLTKIPGRIAEYANKTITILKTGELTEGQYQALSEEAARYNCQLVIRTLAPSLTPLEFKNAGMQIIETNDPDFYITNLLPPGKKTIIPVGPHSDYGLVERWRQEDKTSYINEEGVILRALLNGENVVLKSNVNPKLKNRLLTRLQTLFCDPPYLEFNGKPIYLSEERLGKLFLVSEKNPYPYIQPHVVHKLTLAERLAPLNKEQAELIQTFIAEFNKKFGVMITLDYISQVVAIKNNLSENPTKNPLEWLLLLQKYSKSILATHSIEKILSEAQTLFLTLLNTLKPETKEVKKSEASGTSTPLEPTSVAVKITAPEKESKEKLASSEEALPLKGPEKEENELTIRMKKINDRLTKLPFLFLIGPSASGKSTTILKEFPFYLKHKTVDESKLSTVETGEGKIEEKQVKDEAKTEKKEEKTAADEVRTYVAQPPLLDSLEKWAENTDASRKILFIDEANLASDDIYSIFEGMLKDPREVVHKNRKFTLTDKHQIIFAGNYQHYEKRVLHPIFLKYDCVEHFPRFSKEFELEHQVKPIVEQALKDLKPESETGYVDLVMKFLSDAMSACNTIVGQEKITVRNLQSMALSFHHLLRSKILESVAPPLERLQILANWAFYQNTRDILDSTKANELKLKFFGKHYDSLKKSMPRVKQGLLGKLYITTPHKRALAVLCEELSLREIRTTTAGGHHLSYGTRGTLLEGAPGVGKSSLAIEQLHQLGFKEASEASPGDTKIYYHISAMLPDQMEETLTKAFHGGAVVVIDELNALPLEGLLNSLMMGVDLEGKPPKKEGFYVIGTQNPISLSQRQKLSLATENRFRKIHVPDYTERSLTKLLQAKYKDVPSSLVQLYCQKYFTAKAKGNPYNFRDLIQEFDYAYSQFNSRRKIAEENIAKHFPGLGTLSPEDIQNLPLIDFLADPPKEKQTLLSQALSSHNWRLVDALLLSGANPHSPLDPSSPECSLSTVIQQQNAQGVLRLLDNKLATIDPNNNLPGCPYLLPAIQTQSREIIRILLNAGAKPTVESLLEAIRIQDCEVCQSLLTKLDKTVIDTWSSSQARPLIFYVAQNTSLNLLPLFLEKETNPDPVNTQGDTLLLHATQQENSDYIKLLLKHGANPCIKNKEGISPLLWAFRENKTELVSLLFAHVNPNYLGAMKEELEKIQPEVKPESEYKRGDKTELPSVFSHEIKRTLTEGDNRVDTKLLGQENKGSSFERITRKNITEFLQNDNKINKENLIKLLNWYSQLPQKRTWVGQSFSIYDKTTKDPVVKKLLDILKNNTQESFSYFELGAIANKSVLGNSLLRKIISKFITIPELKGLRTAFHTVMMALKGEEKIIRDKGFYTVFDPLDIKGQINISQATAKIEGSLKITKNYRFRS